MDLSQEHGSDTMQRLLFSRAGLNAARDEALVSMSYYCGSLCAEGGVFLMVKEDGVWKVEQAVASWMA